MWRRLQMMLARAVVSMVSDQGRHQILQLKLLDGELKDGVEYIEPYGFTSLAPAGAREALALFFDGDRSHGVAICVANRQYRLTGLKDGEVALYDRSGQKIVLGKEDIVLYSPSKVRIETPRLECTGEIVDQCQSGGASMSAMRAIYNQHTHVQNAQSNITAAPSQQLEGSC